MKFPARVLIVLLMGSFFLLLTLEARADGFIYSETTNTLTPVTGTNAPPGGFFPTGINDKGQLVGVDASDNHSYLYSNGAFEQILVPFAAPYVRVQGINDSGVIVGYAGFTAFIDNGGTFTILAVPVSGFAVTNPFAINNSGEVVGTYDTGTSVHGFLYQNGAYTTIDYPGATSTQLVGINNHGQILGDYVGPNASSGSFIDTNGIFTNLTLPCGSRGLGFNDSVQVVGGFCGNSAWIYDTNTGTTTTISNALWFYYADDINNEGQAAIVGEEIPEPSSLTLLDSGILFLLVASLKTLMK